MSQCVPNWELDDTVRPSYPTTSTSTSDAVPYEMAELTWENGQLSMHGLGLRRAKSTWDRPISAAAGTLESIVAPCFGTTHQPIMDVALVPCEEGTTRRQNDLTRVGSCSGAKGHVPKKARAVPAEANVSVSLSKSTATLESDSWHVPTTVDTCCDKGFTSIAGSISSSGLPATTANDDHDSVCHSRPPQSETGEEQDTKRNAKSSSSTRRSRAAAIHNQSERKRRDKINQKMKTLQKLVPNSNKTDKASMLDEVIDYLKQLQAQVQMMCRMSMAPAATMNMMMPQLAMQQQLHMSMIAAAAASPMGMGMGMGMSAMGMGMAAMPSTMDMDLMARQNQLAPFMPLANAWDAAVPLPDRLASQAAAAAAAAAAVVPTDPISSYLACQSQPMTIEAYSRMIALIQQQQQQLSSLPKH